MIAVDRDLAEIDGVTASRALCLDMCCHGHAMEVADEQDAVIIFWLMGSFGSKTWSDVGITFLFILIGFLLSINLEYSLINGELY